MRIGIGLTEPTGPDALAKLRTTLQRAADDGLSSAWATHIFGLDALTSLAVAGSGIPGLELGTSVVPTYPRHPAALAQQALTTALAVEGRLTLGIGLSHQIVIEGMFGHDFSRPLRHLDEYLSVLLPLLDDKPAQFTGETLTGNITLSPPRTGRVPVVVAALGTQMLKLAGERADGTVTWMTGPATLRDHTIPTITAAGAAAGRPAPRVISILPVCVTDDPEAATARAADVFKVYGFLPSYRAMLDREGATGPEGVAIVGDEDTVAARIQDLAAIGVTDFIAGEYASGKDGIRTRALLKSLA
ncbi:TIGR03564 family F420-dependent LLM class oxidoreductase [Actinocorallia longicatena]|uniref:TIGR03564 family F420-dependent LLM class oxidoreductase n=1 Tax=Actinocorallia longicatena TaxID=111803 RepID=A0ABP6QRN0_9ACTN